MEKAAEVVEEEHAGDKEQNPDQGCECSKAKGQQSCFEKTFVDKEGSGQNDQDGAEESRYVSLEVDRLGNVGEYVKK